jgi:hypothetical protein
MNRMPMKYLLAILSGLVLVGVSPAWSAPPWVEDYCQAQASQIWFNGRGDREHFMANCIANHTPTPSPTRRKYKKPRY